MSIFWIIFSLGWMAYAAFVGLTGLLICRVRGFHLLPYIAVSALIVVPTTAVLINQNAFQGSGDLTYWLSMASLALLVAAWFVSRSLPSRIAQLSRYVIGSTFLAAVLWTLGGPGGFFLPLLFFPQREILYAHSVFSVLFVLISVATFQGLKRIPVEKVSFPQLIPPVPSMAGKTSPRWRLGLHLALAFLILFWLAQWAVPKHYGGLVNVWGEPGMSSAMLDESEILCSGHFSSRWQPFRWCWEVELKPEESGPSYRRAIQARRKIVPFYADHYWKGSGPPEINVALFEPSESFWHDAWLMPAEENLLVALKKDTTGSGGYQLVNQVNSWLVVTSAPAASPPTPENAIQTCARDYLEGYAARPEARRPVKLLAPLTIDSISGLGGTLEVNNVRVVQQVLATVRNFHMKDERTLAILKKLLASPEPHTQIEGNQGATVVRWTSGSPVHQDVLSTLAQIDATQVYSDFQARLKAYNNSPPGAGATSNSFAIIGDDHFNFPAELSDAIQNADDLGKLMPLVPLALESPDPRMRLSVTRALRQRQTRGNEQFKHGNQLGNQIYPVLVKLLDDPDPEVQYAAMGCIFEMSGCSGQRFGHRDLELWATTIVQQDPSFYVAQYKDWWKKYKSELGL